MAASVVGGDVSPGAPSGQLLPGTPASLHVVHALQMVVETDRPKHEVLLAVENVRQQLAWLESELKRYESESKSNIKKLVASHAAEVKRLNDRINQLEKSLLDERQRSSSLEAEKDGLLVQISELQDGMEDLRMQLREQQRATECLIAKTKSEVRAEVGSQLAKLTRTIEQQQRQLGGTNGAQLLADTAALEAGQIAFDFVNLAKEYVLGRALAATHINDISDLDDLATAVEEEYPEGSTRMRNLQQALGNRSAATKRAVKTLKTDRLLPAHPTHTRLLSLEDVRALLVDRMPITTADAFVHSLDAIRKLHQNAPN